MGGINKIMRIINKGELSVDKQGRIWRHSVRIGGAGHRQKILDRPRRAENKIKNPLMRNYYQIQTWENGERIVCMAHRLVWYYFNGEIPNKYLIHHINNDALDNSPDNLKCITHSEHSKIHPKKTWNKGISDVLWHRKTTDAKKRNYIKRTIYTHQLRYKYGYKATEIAEILDITTRSVHKQLQDYRKRGDAKVSLTEKINGQDVTIEDNKRQPCEIWSRV